MRAYAITRWLLLIIPTLFILTVLVFLLVRFIPGDVIDIIEGRLFYEGGNSDIGLDREAAGAYTGLGRACLRAVWTLVGSVADPSLDTGEFQRSARAPLANH